MHSIFILLENLFFGLSLGIIFYGFCILGNPFRLPQRKNLIPLELLANFFVGSLIFYWVFLILSGYFQLDIYLSVSVFLVFSVFCLIRQNKMRTHVSMVALFCTLFLLSHWVMSLENPVGDYFDYYAHWGYVVKRILIDHRIPISSRVYEYSMWNYPEMNVAWALPLQMVFKTEMFIRYRSIPLLVCIVLILLHLFKNNEDRKIFFAGAIATACIFIAYWFPVLLPRMYFTAYADLPFALVLFIIGLMLISFEESKNLKELMICVVCLAVLSQIRYDGIFIYPFLFIGGLYLLFKRKEMTRLQILLILICLFTPWLWIIYQKWVGNIHGSFEKLDFVTGIARYPRVIKQVLKEYPILWILTLWNIFCVFRIKGPKIWRMNIIVYLLMGAYLGGMFYVASAEWGFIFETQRYCCRVNPLLFFITAYNLVSLVSLQSWTKKIPLMKLNLNWRPLHIYGAMFLLLLISLNMSKLSAQSEVKVLPQEISKCARMALAQDLSHTPIIYAVMDDGKVKGLDMDGYFQMRHYFYPQRIEAIRRADLKPDTVWNIDDGENQIRINDQTISCN